MLRRIRPRNRLPNDREFLNVARGNWNCVVAGETVAYTQRERYIGIGTLVALGFGALWYFAISPYLDQRASLHKDDEQAQTAIEHGNDTLTRRDRLNRVWKVMQADGMKMDSSAAESQVLQALFSWAQSSGLTVSIRREHDSTEGKFQLISFRATATGGMKSIRDMLWHIESASIPMRINDLEVTPRKGEEDDLAIQFGVSTLCQLAEADKSKVGN
jgi:1,2-phenylacetyl-CoA epoxidase PaaB subunit